MVMNSDKISLKSFDVKKINIESVVINTMVGTYSLNVSYSIYKLYYDIDFSNQPTIPLYLFIIRRTRVTLQSFSTSFFFSNNYENDRVNKNNSIRIFRDWRVTFGSFLFGFDQNGTIRIDTIRKENRFRVPRQKWVKR